MRVLSRSQSCRLRYCRLSRLLQRSGTDRDKCRKDRLTVYIQKTGCIKKKAVKPDTICGYGVEILAPDYVEGALTEVNERYVELITGKKIKMIKEPSGK